MSAPASSDRLQANLPATPIPPIGPSSFLWRVLSPDPAPDAGYSSNRNTSSSGAANTRAMRKAASRLGE